MNNIQKSLGIHQKKVTENAEIFEDLKRGLLSREDTDSALVKYIIHTEQLAISARNLPVLHGGASDDRFKLAPSLLPMVHEVIISLTPEGWVRIWMDALLPLKENGARSFICAPLDYALDNFQSRTMYQADYSRATIAVRHVYANNTPLGMIRDHDNIETKAVIDTIKSHFLPDDNGMFLNLFFTAGFGQKTGTEIFLLPYADTSDWIEFYG